MATYDEDLSYCPADTGPVLARFGSQCDDEAAEELGALFQPRGTELPPVLCFRGLTGTLAGLLEPYASAEYVIFLLSRIWSIRGELGAHPAGAAYLDPDYLSDLRRPYSVLLYEPPEDESRYARVWFGCARALNIDCREQVKDRIVWDWSFGSGYLHSETWNHAKYLITYDDPDATKGVTEKLETIEDGNVLLGLLRDLVNTPVLSDSAVRVVEAYREDPRPTDNGIVEMDPIPLGTEVQGLLQRIETRRSGGN
jgi:hypothetical protein